jgi:hypothetical protein
MIVCDGLASGACHRKDHAPVTTAVLNALSAHPAILLGVLVGVVITAFLHFVIRRIRRLITTGVVLAVAGGGAAGGGSTFLQMLPHWH